MFTVRGEDTMEPGEVDSWFGYQGDQSGNGRSSVTAPALLYLLLPCSRAHPCARDIPFILNIKSNGSKMTWVVPLRQGVRLKRLLLVQLIA